MKTFPKLVISLDTDVKTAKKVVSSAVKLGFDIFKIGHLLFYTSKEIVEYIISSGGKVILDLKFYDIPSVIEKIVSALVDRYNFFGFTVHTLGGKNLIKSVSKILAKTPNSPLLFAVTVLTSLSEKDLQMFGFYKNLNELIITLAKIAKNSGADGVVCSPKEVELIKASCGRKFLTLVPAVTLKNSHPDQKRTANIKEVILTPADYIVIGREIYNSSNITSTLEKIRTYFI